MRKIISTILIVLTSFSFLGFAHSEDKNAYELEEFENTELNFFTGMFDFSDHKQKAGIFGLQHQNEELFINTGKGHMSPITGAFITTNNAFYLYTGVEVEYQIGSLNFTPSFAPGYYGEGNGKDLGYPLEFKTEVQLSLNLLEKYSWNKISIKLIFDKAKIDYGEGHKVVKQKSDILLLINEYIDYLVIKSIQRIEESTNHDKLFESLMARFEVLNLYRVSVIKIYKHIIRNPDLIIFFLPLLSKSLNMMIELLNISWNGLYGKIKIEVFVLIYIAIFLEWSKDESEDLEKTMVAVDKYLNKIEYISQLLKKK